MNLHTRLSLFTTICLIVALQSFAQDQPQPTAAESEKAHLAKREDSQQLLAEFRRTYDLADKQVIKRVPPPFTAGRLKFYHVHESHQAQILPEPPDYFFFRWRDIQPVGKPEPKLEGKLHNIGMGWTGDEGQSIASLLNSFVDVHEFEMQGDRALTRIKVNGDWVIRESASHDEILAGLQTILQRECKVPIQFKLVNKLRKVLVAEGEYAFRPLPGNEGFTDEAGEPWDRIAIYENDRLYLDHDGGSSIDDLFMQVSMLIDCPIVSTDITRFPKNSVSWNGSSRRFLEIRKQGNADRDALLQHLTEQTGLKFSEAYRKGRVLRVERAKLPD
jgi:hypothetical protein